MINILFEGMTNNIGGKETYIINLFNNLDKKKYRTYFVVYDAKIAYEEYLISKGAIIIRVPNRKNNYIKFISEIRKFFYSNKIDVVWSHKTTLSSCELLFLAKKYNVPNIILHSHATKNLGNCFTYILHIINRFFVKYYVNTMLACSKEASDWMFHKNSDSLILKNTINLKKFRYNLQTRIRIRKQLGLIDEFVIGHIGRFSKEKNHKKLINIFSELNKKTKSFLLLCGEGPEKESIEDLVEKLGLSSVVNFLGNVNNISELLQAMDVVVMPSLHEGFPFALIEAQAAGLPCLMSDTICKEIDVTKNNMFLPLLASDENWSLQLEKIKNKEFNREYGYYCLKKEGFDSFDSIKQIETVIGLNKK